MGSRTSGETVTITVAFTRPIGLTPPNSFKLTLLDASNNQPLLTQPNPFGIDYSFNPLRKHTETLTWNVGQDGNYRMLVERTETDDPKGMVIYDLSAEVGGGNIVTGTDILRGNYLYHLLYVAADGTSISIRNTLRASGIDLFAMESTSSLIYTSPFTALPSSPGTNLKDYTLNSGYYGLRIAYASSAGSTSYQSDQYLCPTTPGLSDLRGTFRPCGGGHLPPFIDPVGPVVPESGLFVTPPDINSLPRFTLNSLSRGDVINIRLDFPDLIPATNPQSFTMKLLSSSGAEMPIQPIPMGVPIPVAQAYETFWTVPADGSYLLEVISADPLASEALQWYYLTVWDTKTALPLVKQIDMLRSKDSLFRYIYAEPTSTISSLAISHSGGTDKSTLFSMNSGNKFTLDSQMTGSTFQTSNIYTVSQGYYLARFDITLGTES